MQKLLLVYYHSENRATSQIWSYFQIWFFPDLGGKNGGVLNMRMQVILDSSFARPGSAPIWGGKKGEFRDWTMSGLDISNFLSISKDTCSVEYNDLAEYNISKPSVFNKLCVAN